MALKTYKPITPSLRQLVIVDRSGPTVGIYTLPMSDVLWVARIVWASQ